MTYTDITVETDAEHIGTVTLNRPQYLNTFTSQMAGELSSAFLELERDPGIRVVLVKGAGRAFCAGIDVNELSGQTAMQYRGWIERMEHPLTAISKMKKPVIAQVHGVAAANGMGLAAAADLVVASQDARMGLTAINVGLNCVGPVIPVARCVGRKKALELLFYGRLIDAPEALSLGLVNKVVAKEVLEIEARQWAVELAQKSPIALQIAKSAFYESEDMGYEKQFAHMNEVFVRLCMTDDAREGVAAFLEKRNPVWTEK